MTPRSDPRAVVAPAMAHELEPAANYQRGLATTFAALTVILAAFEAIRMVVSVAQPSLWHRFYSPVPLLALARLPVLATGWAMCRLGERTANELRRIEITVTFLAMALTSVPLAVNTEQGRSGLFGLLFLFLLLILRAGLVPATVRRATAVAVVGAVPLVIAGVVRSVLELDVHSAATLANVVVWSLAGVWVARLVARTIAVLRREVHEAQKFGQYTLEERLGAGGMGEVYRARHALLRRPAAIKVLKPELATEEDVRRFEREVQATSRLRHPNTISIFDYGRTVDRGFYYVMELLDGYDLQQLVSETGPATPARTIHILQQVCGSLNEAHTLGLVHRDIKPANIIITERPDEPDIVKVVDFGLVKTHATEGDPTLSAGNLVIGTPSYIAPETVTGLGADARSDLYAVGAVGYFLLTGRHAFVGDTPRATLAKHLVEEPEPPSKVASQPVPADLEEVIMRCLRKQPTLRPTSAEELRRELLACEDAGRFDVDAARKWWREQRARPRAPKGLAEAPTEQVLAIDTIRDELTPSE